MILGIPSVDWIHPSVRDTVIEYLMDHDFDRQRFLATARASGAVIALSTAGGSQGTLQRPLLRNDADWDALAETVLRIASSSDIVEQYVLLQGVGEALRASKDDEEVATLIRSLTVELLSGLRSSWDIRTEAITLGALRLFYDLSIRVGCLVPSPNLSPTWRQLVDNLESALNDRVQYFSLDNASSWIRLVKILRENEPRFLRIEITDTGMDGRVRGVINWIKDWCDTLAVLDVNETEVVEERPVIVEAPAEPGVDESDEIFILREAAGVINEIIDLDDEFVQAGNELIDAIQEQRDVRKTREGKYSEWKSERDSDYIEDEDSSPAARTQGSGDFDIVEFFSDL
jgi:acetolactate synthase small subunit